MINRHNLNACISCLYTLKLGFTERCLDSRRTVLHCACVNKSLSVSMTTTPSYVYTQCLWRVCGAQHAHYWSLILLFFISRSHSAVQGQAVTVCVLFHQLHRSYGSSERWSRGVHGSAHVWKPACWTRVTIWAAKVETVLGLPGSDRGTWNSGSQRHFPLKTHTWMPQCRIVWWMIHKKSFFTFVYLHKFYNWCVFVVRFVATNIFTDCVYVPAQT